MNVHQVVETEDLLGLTAKPKIVPAKKMRPMFVTKLKAEEVVRCVHTFIRTYLIYV